MEVLNEGVWKGGEREVFGVLVSVGVVYFAWGEGEFERRAEVLGGEVVAGGFGHGSMSGDFM